MPEYVKTTPRLAASAMSSNPKLQIAVSEKGGISVYGLGRFPVTLYFEQWERLFNQDVVAEILNFGTEHADILGEKPQAKAKAEAEDRTFSLKPAEITLVGAEVNRLAQAGDMMGAVKYNTIKTIAESGRKIGWQEMTLVMELVGRKPQQ